MGTKLLLFGRYVIWERTRIVGGTHILLAKYRGGPLNGGKTIHGRVQPTGRVTPLIQEKEKEKNSWAGTTHVPACDE